jgi:hypothetical protein
MSSHPKEVECLLRQAQHEIRRLRESNGILSARIFVRITNAVEAFHAALLGAPRGGGMSPDICWEIDRYLQRSQDEPAKQVEE